MPVAVFAVGCTCSTETFSVRSLLNMVVVTLGVAIASYGEINLAWIGVFLQLLSVMTESTRLTLVSPEPRLTSSPALQNSQGGLCSLADQVTGCAAGANLAAEAGTEPEPHHHHVLHRACILCLPLHSLGHH